MGLERICMVRWEGRVAEGKAHCGESILEFRGEFRIKWKWEEIEVSLLPGVLIAKKDGQVAEFELGEHAAKWQHTILNPKTWLDKIALKRIDTYEVRGNLPLELQKELQDRHGDPTVEAIVVIAYLHQNLDLGQIEKAMTGAALWVIFPKGNKEFPESDIRNFIRSLGWVDVKIASINSFLSSIKFVPRVSAN